MRRRNADREEKRVTRGNGTKKPTGALELQSLNQRRLSTTLIPKVGWPTC
jgi:hypothetical protein